MRHPTRIAQLALAALSGALLGGGGYALASSSTTTIHGCVNKNNHQLLIQKRCGKGQSRLVWNQQGPQGIQGATGAQGPQGVQGPTGGTGVQGPAGTSPTIWWARVSSSGAVVAGSNFQVGHVGPGEYQVFPQGATGSLSPPCALTVTPNAVSTNGADQPATPTTAAVGTSGLSEPGAAITVLLNNATTGAAVDDGFSVIAEC
jgi:hypothetical protein